MTTPSGIPVISVYNQAKTPLGLDLAALVAAMQQYMDGCVTPVWGCAVTLNVTTGPVAGTWGMVFLDDADQPGALAYHQDDGSPLAKVFVATTLQAGESLSVSASHELAEMTVDPACNSYSMSSAGTLYFTECCDAAEESSFTVSGFSMSDFCYPAYFGQPGNQYDYCKVLTAPFSLASGGYATTLTAGNMQQVFGSQEKAARFALEDRRGHRSEFRRAQFQGRP